MKQLKLRTAIFLVGVAAILAWAWQLWTRDPLEKAVSVLNTQQSDPQARGEAMKEIALNWSRLDPDFAIPLLIKAVRDPNPDVRSIAVMLLYAYKGKTVSAVPALIDALKDADTTVRIGAVNTLGLWLRESNRMDSRIAAALKDATKDEKLAVRTHARNMLSRAGLGETTADDEDPENPGK